MYPVAAMCRVLGVSPSGYYAWRDRPVSARSARNTDLMARIRQIHAYSRGTYGAPRVHAELREQGTVISRKRVARLMAAAGLRGVSRRRWIITTQREEGQRPAPDLVERQFSSPVPNRLWVSDITHLPTWEGELFLAVVLDVFSRRVVGWAMSTSLKTELVLDALNMALKQRRAAGVIHHSDQGSQYASIAFGERCRAAGVRPSMGSVGDAYDNALCESFFATVECELINRDHWTTRSAARTAVFEFIEGWYNPSRRHSGIGYLSPMEFERRYYRALGSESITPSTLPG